MKELWKLSILNKVLIVLFWVLATPLLVCLGLDSLLLIVEYGETFPTWVITTTCIGIVLFVKKLIAIAEGNNS